MSQAAKTKRPGAARRPTPAKRAQAAKRTTAKKTAKKTATKRAATKKTAAKRPAAKRTATKKTTAKRATAKRTATKKTTAKRGTAKRTTARKAAVKRPSAKRPAARKASAKRAPARKVAAKRTEPARKVAAKRTAPARKAAVKRTAVKRSAAKRPAARAPASSGPAAKAPAPELQTPTLAATPAHDPARLLAGVMEAGRAAGTPEDVLGQVRRDPFAALEWLVRRRAALSIERVAMLTMACEALLRYRIFVHPGAGGAAIVPVVFGTGGHRGVIGSGLTLLHVHAIVTALLRAMAGMSPAQRAEHFGTASLAEVQRRGFVLGHDNRLFNPDFAFYAASLLREAGYTVRYAGRVSSPELSLLVPLMGWAGSLNFTPSHNPFRWGGLKFAPADGGLAGGDLTDPLAAEANRLLEATAPGAWPAPAVLEARIAAEAQRIEHVDVHDTYLDALAAHPVVRLTDLIVQLKALPAGRRLAFVADPVWGAAVPVYLRLQRRMGTNVLRLLHTEVDPYFGGQVTEPNEQTLADALALLRATPAAHKVMIRNDPDSDRGLVGDEAGAVQMNRFAPLVFRYLRDVGQTGELLTTLPTSHLGPDYARAHGGAVVLTPTGFKNFRAHLKSGRALVAYEESNGITVRGHTLDKDGVLAGLLALRIVLHYGRPLSALVAELEAEQGHYHYRQETFTIDMSAAEAQQRLKKLGAVRPGDPFTAAGHPYTIQEVNAEDGYKLILGGGAWVMMRPSGTEPKVRIYAESRESEATTQALCAAAREMALAAVREP